MMSPDQTEAQRKKIFEPNNVEELLRGWVLHAHKGRDRHDVAARENDRNRRWLGIPTIVLSAMVGTSMFASLGQDALDPLLKILVGLFSIAAVVFTSLQTFFDYANRAEIHRATGVKYKVIIRQLEQILSQPAKSFNSEDDWLSGIRESLDVLEEEAPIVPHEIYDHIESTYNSNVEIVKKAIKLYAPKCDG
jgi:hypothetical protein